MLEASDKAISAAEQSLPEGIQTHKTVFGVKESWVEDAHITKDYLAKLKTLSEELDLQPIGFLVFPEAIAHLLQKEEGAPVSGILVDIGAQIVSLTLIRAGRIVATKETPLQDSLTDTVETGLKMFENVEIFPSRIILFETEDTTIEKKFLRHQWSKSLPFLHVPQVTTLAHDFDTRAILYGTATQMGFDAIDLIKETNVTRETEESNENSNVIQGNEVTLESNRSNEESDSGLTRMTEKKEETEKELTKAVSIGGETEVSASTKNSDNKGGLQAEASVKVDNDRQDSDKPEKQSSEFFGFVKDSDVASAIPVKAKLSSVGM